MQLALTQSDLTALCAAIDMQRQYLLLVAVTTTGKTSLAAQEEIWAQDKLRKKLCLIWPT